MQLVGYMDSPFVRRVAVSAQFLGVELERREISIFREFEKFREVNPIVKIPTLIGDDGMILIDSSLIIGHLESTTGKSLMPVGKSERLHALHLIGVGLAAMEKLTHIIYETQARPAEYRYQPWLDRVLTQLRGAVTMLEDAAAERSAWLAGDKVSQADITVAIAWRFVQHIAHESVSGDDYPYLVKFAARAEALAEFRACPIN